MTESERIVSELCKNTFLSFWSFRNPVREDGKELCDVLIVCGNNVIIFSVKDISVKASGDFKVDYIRWQKRAIEDSVRQLYGAEKKVLSKEIIFSHDKKEQILLNEENFNIYRIAIAFGGKNKFPLTQGDFGKGFIHVLDELTTLTLLNELDTVSDFINFLNEKENLFNLGVKSNSFFDDSLLAIYFQNYESLPFDIDSNIPDSIIFSATLWGDYIKSVEYREEKEQNKNSYFWDNLIELLIKDYRNNALIRETKRNEVEIVLRIMNKESRFKRRQLSKIFYELVKSGERDDDIKARMVKFDQANSIVYVFMCSPSDKREERIEELEYRCWIARQIYKDSQTIVGIATDKITSNKGFSIDFYYLYLPELDEKTTNNIERLKKEFGYFSSPKMHTL